MTSEESDFNYDINKRIEPANALGNLSVFAAITMPELLDLATTETAQVMFEILSEHPEMEVRVEQLEALDAIQKCRQAGQSTALLQMATGLGKTNVIAADVRRFLEQNPGKRVAFFCDQNDILNQAKDRFQSILGNRYTFGTLTGEEEDLHEVDCLFASLQAMRNWRDAFYEDEFAYIAVDESHHSKAPTYEPTLNYFEPEFLIGITATPDRHDLKDIREIFGSEIYQLPLEEAIARGLLAKVDYRILSDDTAIKDLLQQASKTHFKKLTEAQINRSIFLPIRDEEMAKIIMERGQELDSPPKRIIFCNSIEYTEEFATYFEHAAPLHSRLPKWEQDKYIEQFRYGQLDTLLTVDMFNEGIDIPDANQIVFLRSTQSKTIFLQQLGRGLRKIPGKDLVQVLDFVANCDRLTMLDEMWSNVSNYVREASMNYPESLIRIDIGGISFSEEVREILEILDDIHASSERARNWTAEDSIKFYRDLDKEIKTNIDEENMWPSQIRRAKIKMPSEHDINVYAFHYGGPKSNVVLRPFNGDINSLRVAAGFPEQKGLYTKDELLDFMANIIEETGRSPNSTDFMKITTINAPNLNQVRNHFSSYDEFRKEANKLWLKRRKEKP